MSPSRRSEKILQIISSERLGRDMNTLMNSPFWVEALKKGFAKGVGDRLYSQLTEAQKFIHNFVTVYIGMKQISLNKSLQISSHAPEIHKSENFNQQCESPPIKMQDKMTPVKSLQNSMNNFSYERDFTEMEQFDFHYSEDQITAAKNFDDIFVHPTNFVDISSSAYANLKATLNHSHDFNNNDILPSLEKRLQAASSVTETSKDYQKNDVTLNGHCMNDEAVLNLLYDQLDDFCQKQTADKFIVECSFLAILISDEILSNTSALIQKLNDWFPQMKLSSVLQKSSVEKLLKQSPLFKRLMNLNKMHVTKPIILGKRPTMWSINDHHLKIFFKCFQKLQRAIPLLDQQVYLPQIGQNQLHFHRVWKRNVEQLKLYMQLKHSGYMWLESSPLAHETKANTSLDNSPEKTPRNNFESQSVSNFDTNNENSYSCFPPHFVFTKIRSSYKAKNKSILKEPLQFDHAQPRDNFASVIMNKLMNNNEISLSSATSLNSTTSSISYFGNSGNVLSGRDDAMFNDVIIAGENEISIEDDLLF